MVDRMLWGAAFVVLALTGCTASPVITASSAAIESGITSELTISCEAGSSNTMTRINGLSISFSQASNAQQNGQIIHLASVIPFLGVTGIDPHISPVVHGDIANPSSFLNLTFHSPNKTLAGSYECTATGIDIYGQNVAETSKTDVKSKSPDLLKVVSGIKKDHVKQNGRWDAVDSNNFFISSGVHKKNNHKYLLSTVAEDHVSLCQFMCSVHGGYLAEINDQEELDYVRTFVRPILKGKPNYPDVFLGATDEGQKGSWKFLHNTQDTPYLEWGALPGNGYDCMILQERADFAMNDERCEAHNRFLCEVPVY